MPFDPLHIGHVGLRTEFSEGLNGPKERHALLRRGFCPTVGRQPTVRVLSPSPKTLCLERGQFLAGGPRGEVPRRYAIQTSVVNSARRDGTLCYSRAPRLVGNVAPQISGQETARQLNLKTPGEVLGNVVRPGEGRDHRTGGQATRRGPQSVAYRVVLLSRDAHGHVPRFAGRLRTVDSGPTDRKRARSRLSKSPAGARRVQTLPSHASCGNRSKSPTLRPTSNRRPKPKKYSRSKTPTSASRVGSYSLHRSGGTMVRRTQIGARALRVPKRSGNRKRRRKAVRKRWKRPAFVLTAAGLVWLLGQGLPVGPALALFGVADLIRALQGR